MEKKYVQIVIRLGPHERGLHPISMKARLVEKPLDHWKYHYG